jgi:hypothetical protein
MKQAIVSTIFTCALLANPSAAQAQLSPQQVDDAYFRATEMFKAENNPVLRTWADANPESIVEDIKSYCRFKSYGHLNKWHQIKANAAFNNTDSKTGYLVLRSQDIVAVAAETVCS